MVRCRKYGASCNKNIINSVYNKRVITTFYTTRLLDSSERLFYSTPLICSVLMRSIVFLPIGLIKTAYNENWLRELSYFVKLKSLYKNNTHYNFTLRSLATKMKCSPGCLSYHIKSLKDRGLVRIHAGNITFLGLHKLQDKYKANCIGIPVDFKNQFDIVRAQIIRFNLSAQEYNLRKSGLQKQYQKYVPNTYLEKTSSSYTGLSALGVGYLFGLSGQSGSRIRRKLDKLGIIKVYRVFSYLHKNVSINDYKKLKWLGDIPVYAKYLGNNIIVERRNRIEYIAGNGDVS